MSSIIILDLEMNIAKEKEIIEIAAVRLDSNNEIVNEFSTYVKPVNYQITDKTTKLTGITREKVDGAETFEKALISFLEWLGNDYQIIYSWSMSDYYQVKKECERKMIVSEQLDKALNAWADFQREFGDSINYSGKLSLKNAISAIDYKFEGHEHSALDDARNTAILFEIAHDVNKRTKLDAIKEWFIPKEITSTIGELFPQLALCLG